MSNPENGENMKEIPEVIWVNPDPMLKPLERLYLQTEVRDSLREEFNREPTEQEVSVAYLEKLAIAEDPMLSPEQQRQRAIDRTEAVIEELKSFIEKLRSGEK